MCGVGLLTVAMRTFSFAFPDSLYMNNANVKRFEVGGGDYKTRSWQINEAVLS